ncbi:hypothetical protein KDA_77040 [Dictyobacter alpinus]|uniref:Uncharacterized protein n=1 Tax=Dictyobacter alpinus TaxID=2014873 RepID=A0A402BLP1_9CHLR|nr:hypothetical protein [Dictyobacter alpinus]GCE32220.1 hypothetical protein KDA_77040 [Dictyobacter alpinus]
MACHCNFTSSEVEVCEECTTAILSMLLGLGVMETGETGTLPATLMPAHYHSLKSAATTYTLTLSDAGEVRQ